MFRLDAKKMLMRYRKPTARMVNNVGIWHDIMVGLARIAVLSNAFLIAVTSDFIPRLVYTSYHSDTGVGEHTSSHVIMPALLQERWRVMSTSLSPTSTPPTWTEESPLPL